MSGAEIAFDFFAAVALVAALATVTRRGPITAAVWLVVSFVAAAACYVLLSATFLAAIQVLVYAGAIMVLFVFVIMVLDVDESGYMVTRGRVRDRRYVGLVAVALLFIAWVLVGTWARQFITNGADLSQKPMFGTATSVGRELFNRYLFAFEAVSLLLMAAVVGAVAVARSRKEREQAADPNLDERARRHAGIDSVDGQASDANPQLGPSPFTDFGQPSGSGHQGG